MEFCAIESCGKCTPCRIGSTRGVEVIDRLVGEPDVREQQVVLLRDLCDTMLGGSLCALGGMTPYPVLSALEHFPEDFGLAPAAMPASVSSGAVHALNSRPSRPRVWVVGVDVRTNRHAHRRRHYPH